MIRKRISVISKLLKMTHQAIIRIDRCSRIVTHQNKSHFFIQVKRTPLALKRTITSTEN